MFSFRQQPVFGELDGFRLSVAVAKWPALKFVPTMSFSVGCHGRSEGDPRSMSEPPIEALSAGSWTDRRRDVARHGPVSAC